MWFKAVDTAAQDINSFFYLIFFYSPKTGAYSEMWKPTIKVSYGTDTEFKNSANELSGIIIIRGAHGWNWNTHFREQPNTCIQYSTIYQNRTAKKQDEPWSVWNVDLEETDNRGCFWRLNPNKNVRLSSVAWSSWAILKPTINTPHFSILSIQLTLLVEELFMLTKFTSPPIFFSTQVK